MLSYDVLCAVLRCVNGDSVGLWHVVPGLHNYFTMQAGTAFEGTSQLHHVLKLHNSCNQLVWQQRTASFITIFNMIANRCRVTTGYPNMCEKCSRQESLSLLAYTTALQPVERKGALSTGLL